MVLNGVTSRPKTVNGTLIYRKQQMVNNDAHWIVSNTARVFIINAINR